jgi:hypothetical protein
LGKLQERPISFSFFIENKERSQANVKDFLFIESELRRGIPQIYVRCRCKGSGCGSAAGHRHGHADDSGDRYGLPQVLLLCFQVLLLYPWHTRNLPCLPVIATKALSHTLPHIVSQTHFCAIEFRGVVEPPPSETLPGEAKATRVRPCTLFARRCAG